MNCDILKIVSGNDFATQMTITAIDAAGNVIENFSLEDSTDVVVKYTLAGTSHTIEAYDYDIEGNDITIQWSDLSLGKYGFEIEGKFNGYSWRSAARFIFQIVADNASANIPDGVLVDGVYKLNDWLRLLSGTGGGGKQVQADWTETDTNSPAYIQNKPDFKTINGESILGEGNIEVGGAVESVNGKTGVVVLDAEDVGAATAAQGAKADTALQPTDVDSAMSDTSENPVQNKVVKEAIDDKLSEVTINAIPAGSIAIINDLTTGGATNSLSAEMGKIIKQNVQTILNSLGDYAFPNGKPEISWNGDTPTPTYDAEIEYIESSGTQYIDTLQNLQTACSTYIKMSITKAISSNAMIFGAFMDGANTVTPKAQLYINSSQNWTYSRTENIAVSGITQDTAVSLNTIYELTVTTQSQTNDLKAYLFARNNNGNEFLPIDGMRLYGCTMTKDNVLVRDFIPVRVGQVGYLYDRVSGELFGNAGSGNFILGNDKNA